MSQRPVFHSSDYVTTSYKFLHTVSDFYLFKINIPSVSFGDLATGKISKDMTIMTTVSGLVWKIKPEWKYFYAQHYSNFQEQHSATPGKGLMVFHFLSPQQGQLQVQLEEM